MSIQKFYKEVLFRDYSESDGFIDIRTIYQQGGAKDNFFQDLESLINFVQNKTDVYHGVAIRKSKSGKGNQCVYGNCLYMDIDFHDYDETSWDRLKEQAIEIILKDIFLSQFSVIIDSGRGLHFYYLLPTKTYIHTFKQFEKRLIEYAEGVEFIQAENILDRKVSDMARVLRCPGSINSKTNTEAKILYIEPQTIDQRFLEYITEQKTPKQYTSTFSVSKAMELCGYEPILGRNVLCPFPGHNEENASFRYFEETDTFWCFGCSTKDNKKYFDGIHFLTLMGRPELIPKLKAKVDINISDKYTLDNAGKMWVASKNGDTVIADFLSNKRIEVLSSTHGRKVYIDLSDSVVELTDYPTNREIKRRYLQNNREFLLNAGEAGFSDILTRFILKSEKIDRLVVFNHGMNFYDYRQPVYFLNNNFYPEQDITPVSAVEPISLPKKFKDKTPNINEFIEDLKGDGNYSHIIGFLWGIATISRDIFIKRSGMFPLLVATGIKESGKTLLARLILNMFGYDRSEELDTTSFALIKKLERYGTLPVHFDEFANKKKEMEHEELLKDLSTSVVAIRERGNVALKTDRYNLQCPVIITGEKNITDAGMVSRAIILNLGKSVKKDYGSFLKWSGFVRSGKLLHWFCNFLKNHIYQYRDFINATELSRERDKVKLDVILKTMEYLQQNNLLSAEISVTEIEKIIEDTKIYKENISSDGYTEILVETISDNFEPTKKPQEDYKLSLLMNSFYFDMNKNIVLLNLPSLFEAYKLSVRDAYKKIPSLSEFRINFIQSPDMVGFIHGRKRLHIEDLWENTKKEKRVQNVIFLKVSTHNLDFFRYVLLYKLLPKFNKDIAGLYDFVDNCLDEMRKKYCVFIDNTHSYTVI